jgi:hypothetical protein
LPIGREGDMSEIEITEDGTATIQTVDGKQAVVIERDGFRQVVYLPPGHAEEIERLRANCQSLERALVDLSRANTEALAAYSDVAAKLAAAQAELHDLRIRVGLGGPDWSTAPEWAGWWAVDARGGACWYERQPAADEYREMWIGPGGRVGLAQSGEGWLASLTQRPEAAP